MDAISGEEHVSSESTMFWAIWKICISASVSIPVYIIWMQRGSNRSPQSLTRSPFTSTRWPPAQRSLKGLSASGLHTLAVSMRLLVTGGLPSANGLIGLGGELTWPKPTRPGDTLRVESEIVEILPSRSKPNQGSVKVRSTTLNQVGEAVLVFIAEMLVFKSAST